ncbi:MAG: winged helix-turn-helix domain-containing tetratricopeptide repeat protein [Pyrinomonadaceae bacterium]
MYEIDGYRLDVAKRLVSGADGKPVSLKPKAFETLLYLVEHPGRVIDRDEIMAAVWPETIVEENNLTQHISSLRRSLGEGKNDHRYIVTVPGRGYEFTANVTQTNISDGQSSGYHAASPLLASRKWLAGLGASVIVLLLLSGFFYNREPSTSANGRIRSIAVLPFRPLGDEDRNPSFEMGMTDELITRLGGSEGLTVRSYQAVKKFTSGDADPIEAGRDLGVEAVLNGSTQISEDRVRVSVTLTSIADSRQLWHESFNWEREHIFDVQEEIAKRIANALRIELGENAAKRYTGSSEAYQLYLKGRFHMLRLAPDEIRLGIACMQQAVAIDPNYARAYTGIARGYMSLVLSNELPPGEMGELALAAAEKAVQIDPRLAEAHATLGALNYWFKHDWIASEAAYRTALDLDPDLVFAHVYYASLLSNLGRTEEALEHAEKAREIDPYSAYVTSIQGTVQVHAGRPEEALKKYSEASRIDPSLWLPHSKAAMALIDLHRYDEAVATARKAFELNRSQTNSLALESYALAKLGRRDEARKILDDLLRRSRQGYVPEYHIAVAYAGLDGRENALIWLEKGYIERDPRMLWLESEYFWNDMRSEPRFIELVERMNFPTRKRFKREIEGQ